jgi:hypothetical protein
VGGEARGPPVTGCGTMVVGWGTMGFAPAAEEGLGLAAAGWPAVLPGVPAAAPPSPLPAGPPLLAAPGLPPAEVPAAGAPWLLLLPLAGPWLELLGEVAGVATVAPLAGAPFLASEAGAPLPLAPVAAPLLSATAAAGAELPEPLSAKEPMPSYCFLQSMLSLWEQRKGKPPLWIGAPQGMPVTALTVCVTSTICRSVRGNDGPLNCQMAITCFAPARVCNVRGGLAVLPLPAAASRTGSKRFGASSTGVRAPNGIQNFYLQIFSCNDLLTKCGTAEAEDGRSCQNYEPER